jgi:6,7-dimethyl-8-ribityllumazine synthase
LVVHAETGCVCVCVCVFVLLVLRAVKKHATRHFEGGASLLPSGDTHESVTSMCLVAFGVLTTYLTSQSFQRVRVDALRAEGASQRVE